MNAARSGAISIMALYMRWWIMFWRRMSTMNAIRGLRATR